MVRMGDVAGVIVVVVTIKRRHSHRRHEIARPSPQPPAALLVLLKPAPQAHRVSKVGEQRKKRAIARARRSACLRSLRALGAGRSEPTSGQGRVSLTSVLAVVHIGRWFRLRRARGSGCLRGCPRRTSSRNQSHSQWPRDVCKRVRGEFVRPRHAWGQSGVVGLQT